MNMETNRPRPAWWIPPTTVIAPIAWGTTYVTVTELLPQGRPLFVAAVRVLPAGLALLLVGRLGTKWRPRAGEWRPLVGLSLANFGVFFPLLIVAVYRLPGGVAASVGGVQPFLVAAGTWIVAGVRPRATDLGVGLAAAVGVAFVVVRPDAGIDPLGVAAALGANVAFSLGVVYTRHLPSPAHPVAATGWQLVISGVVLVPLALALEGIPDAPTVRNMAGFGYLSLVGTAAAFLLWFNGVRRLPPAGPPLIGLAAPVTGAVMGWIVLAESLSRWQLLGFAITIGAISYGALLRPVASAERGDRVGDGEDSTGVVDVEVLDHPAVDGDHAATGGLGGLERLDHAS
jgi:probable blue pigment (indigoidine) exporter